MTAQPSETPDPATEQSLPKHGAPGQGTTPPAGAKRRPLPIHAVPRLADPLLALLADVLDDMERTRIANENRLRQLTRTGEDSDGIERGFGLDEAQPDVARCAGLVAALKALEHGAELNLQRQMRAHPLGAWVKATSGVGAKQGARLLATIGDPYWHTLHGRPRTVSELWAWCGLKPDTRRRKGVRSNWSANAKMRAYLVAVSCMKSPTSPYRATYLDRRAHTAVTHPDWTAGHSHNDALRIASKAILRDLWIESKRLHDEVATP